jgi:hypothetical protein
MRIIALCAGLLLASTAAYADKRGLYHPDDMRTARADIRADKRATALAKSRDLIAQANPASLWSFKVEELSKTGQFSSVQSTVFGMYASRRECEQVKSGIQTRPWHALPADGDIFIDKDYQFDRGRIKGRTVVRPPITMEATQVSACTASTSG